MAGVDDQSSSRPCVPRARGTRTRGAQQVDVCCVADVGVGVVVVGFGGVCAP